MGIIYFQRLEGGGIMWVYLIRNKMIKKYWPIAYLALVLPAVSLAAGVDKVGNLLGFVKGWIDKLIPILVGVALLYFIWSTIKLITTDNSEKREEAKSGMWWGIIALFVIVSIWGITAWIGELFDVTKDATITTPKIP
jgi:uncharacterized membrane protein YuzA (DUF378 family)